MMYSFNEIGLIPTSISKISSRKEVNPFTKDGHLPIFVAPMTCILNKDNFKKFQNSKVIPIYPIWNKDTSRLEDPSINVSWISFTLEEFIYWFTTGNAEKDVPDEFYKILIDCANGHMEKIYSSIKSAKQEYGNKLVVMIGNIANPNTYLECCKVGVDYVRVGIGGGSGCTTSVQTGFHASLPWLLIEINKLKKDVYQQMVIDFSMEGDYTKTYQTFTKVIADGGVNSIDKAIKSLALGADYVMMGKCFAQCEEACGTLRSINRKMDLTKGYLVDCLEREYYGQASEQGQIDRFGNVKSHPEGISIWIPVNGTIDDFCTHFEAVLRSAMSYAGTQTLDEFIGNIQYEIQSEGEFHTYIK